MREILPGWSHRATGFVTSWVGAQYPVLEQIIDSAWRWQQRHPDGYID